MVFVLGIGLCFNAFATSDSSTTVDPYESVFNAIIQEYNLELGYVPVDSSKITVEEYEEFTREIAIEQRELLDYIAVREMSAEEPIQQSIMPRTIYTVKKAKQVSGIPETWINLTYDYNDINNQSINPRDGYIEMHPLYSLVNNVYLTTKSGPFYTSLDTGRTIGVKFYVDVDFFNSGASYENVAAYAEFSGR